MLRFNKKMMRRLAKMRFSYRTILRESRFVLILAAAVAGLLGGVVSATMGFVTQWLHEILLSTPASQRLSAMNAVDLERLFISLVGGGLVLGLSTIAWRHWRQNTDIVDPVEANALHGGRMSLRDSLLVMVQSVLSDGFGASVGLEGGLTQGGGALGSKIGIRLERRRNDIRMLVAAGTAGAIACAFNSSLAGAAYGFELILGAYTVATLAPIAIAAMCGLFVAVLLGEHGYHVPNLPIPALQPTSVALIIVLGILSALLGVVLMRGVTLVESRFRTSAIPLWVRPVIGGLIVACLALLTPHVLGSGHGAMEVIMNTPPAVMPLLFLLALKIIACAISLGSGFRGGLFSASLFLGALAGAAFAKTGAIASIIAKPELWLYTLVGMASFAASVVGAPLTMVALALSISNDLRAFVPVMLGVVAAMLTVRRIFGYSFATWRFHLRGEAILGGQDIGWLYKTTARQLMRRGPPVTRGDISLQEFSERFPLASSRYVIGVDGEGAFAGLIDVAQAHASAREASTAQEPVSTIFANSSAYVVANEALSRVMPKFEQLPTEILVVTDSEEHRAVLGILTEEYALKMYQQQLEARQKEIFFG